MHLLRLCAMAVPLALPACSGSNGTGVFGGPLPSGNVIVTPVSAAVTPTGTANAFRVPVSGFSVYVREDHYPSGFDAQVVSYTAPTTIPCWTITVDQSHQPNVATFAPALVPDPIHPGFNICPVRGDVEAVRFVDQRGNSTVYSFVTG